MKKFFLFLWIFLFGLRFPISDFALPAGTEGLAIDDQTGIIKNNSQIIRFNSPGISGFIGGLGGVDRPVIQEPIFIQQTNGNIMLEAHRFTDTAPTGSLMLFRNAAHTVELWRIDITGQLVAGIVPDSVITSAATWHAKENALTFTAPLSRSTNTISMPPAGILTSGYLTFADWNTFANKQSLILPATTDDYYRGDKTFQPLNKAAVTGLHDDDSVQFGPIYTSGILSGLTLGSRDSSGDWVVYSEAREFRLYVNSAVQFRIYQDGTVLQGIWNATPIADTYIASASDWHGKENPLSFTTPLSRSGNTIGLAGLAGLGGANHLVGMNGAANSFEYKSVVIGTAGTNFAVVHSANAITFNLPTASSSNRGALSSSDWIIFNSKESALTFSGPLIRTVNNIAIPPATGLVDGYLDNLDWATFNAKENALTFSGPLSRSDDDISIPAATGFASGYLTSADWANFNSKQAGHANLTALAALSSNGIAARTGTNTWAVRTLTGTTNQVNVSDGDGVSGNPTFSLPQDIHTGASPVFTGIGAGIAPTSSRIIYGKSNQTAATLAAIENTTATGTQTGAGFLATADVASFQFVAQGSSRPQTRYGITLGGWNEIVGVTGNGAIFGTFNNAPVILATNALARATISAAGDFGLGIASPSARFHAVSTTEQMRIGYDASNYFKTTVASNGAVTFDAVGSGASFTFADALSFSGGIANFHDYTIGVNGNYAVNVIFEGDSITQQVANLARTGSGTTTNGSPTVTFGSAIITDRDVGSSISGTGIPSNSYIGVMNSSTSIGLSSQPLTNVPVNATSSATNTLTITPYGYNHYMGAAAGSGAENFTVPAIGTFNGIEEAPVNTGTNVGVAGYTTMDLYRSPARISSRFRQETAMNIVVYLAGTNNLGAGETAAQVYSKVEAHCRALKRKGSRIVLVGLISRGGSNGNGTYDSQIGTVNSLLRQNWAQFADRFVDWGIIGGGSNEFAAGGYSNTTWYSGDQLHTTFAGGRKMALYIQPFINDLLTYYFRTYTNQLFVQVNKSSHTNVFAEGMLTLNNENPSAGQNEINFAFNGTVKGNIRSDFNGTMNYGAKAYHAFYTGSTGPDVYGTNGSDGPVNQLYLDPAKLVSTVPFQILSSATAMPSTGKGLEMKFDSGTDAAIIQSYDHAAPAWKLMYLGASQFNFAPGGTITTRITTAGHFETDKHIGSAGAAPSIVKGGNAGSTATANLADATDLAGTIGITPNGTGIAAGHMATITYNSAYGVYGHPVVTANSAGGAGLVPYVVTAAGSFQLWVVNTPASGTSYTFTYHTLGR